MLTGRTIPAWFAPFLFALKALPAAAFSPAPSVDPQASEERRPDI
jgi:hypothetical protein